MLANFQSCHDVRGGRRWHMRCCKLLLVLFVGLIASGQMVAWASSQETLVKLVVLQRHGVRTPTQSVATLRHWTRHAWPQWPLWGAQSPVPGVKAGERGILTERGAELIKAFWQEERQTLDVAGLWTAGQCPAADSLVVYADVNERTQATAQALLDGLAPQCGLHYTTAALPGPDPLFHPLQTGKARLHTSGVIQRMEQRWGQGLWRLQERLQLPLRELAGILGPSSSLDDKHFRGSAVERPSFLIAHNGVHLKGGLAVASAVTEIFLLEYAQWPDQPAGWGQVDGTVLRRLLPVHTECSAVLNRDPEVARAGAGALAQSILSALAGTHPDKRYNAARLVVFVGHDTNIAQLGGLLGLHWHTEGYAPLQTPPGGALVFALYQRGEEQLVRIHFVTQSLETLHQRQIVPAPLLRTEIKLRGIPADNQCSLHDFTQLVTAALRGEYVAPAALEPRTP